MHLARVKGTVVASQKSKGLEGERLLILQPLNERLEPEGGLMVAVDVAQAGPGDLVTAVMGLEAMFAIRKNLVPVDVAVVGQVDQVEADEGK